MRDFSIITPVLNQASTIEACIDSVARQNVDVEHIIIDGGSTDGTVELIKKHESKLAFWVSESDLGQSHAINKGLEKATGKWFNWLNADDQLHESALQNVLKATNSTTQIVVGKCEHIDETGTVVDIGSARVWKTIEATLGNYSMGQPSVFYRTEIVKELGGLNENLHLCLDMDLWFRFLLKFGQADIKTCDEVLSRFMVRSNSKSSRQAEKMRAEKYGIYRALLEDSTLPDVLRQFFLQFPVPANVNYAIPSDLKRSEMLSYFSWHLMLDAYEKKDFKSSSAYFDVVKNGSALKLSERILWKTHIGASKLFRG